MTRGGGPQTLHIFAHVHHRGLLVQHPAVELIAPDFARQIGLRQPAGVGIDLFVDQVKIGLEPVHVREL